MKLLLDTCTSVWEWFEPRRVSPAVREAIIRSGKVYVSTISLVEIAIKNGKRPFLAIPFEHFVDQILENPNYALVEFPEKAVRVLQSLESIHQDPFDRMLVSLAIAEGFILLTNDSYIRQYPVSSLW